MRQNIRATFRLAGYGLLAACAAFPLHAQNGSGVPPMAPRQLVEEAIANEVKIVQYDRDYLRYRERIVNAKGDTVREMIESRDGPVARLILKDGRTLTKEEDDAEHDRLKDMLASPSAFAKHIHNEDTGKKLAVTLMKMLPEAMIFSVSPGQPQRAGHTGPPEYVLDYEPNPKWNPPSMTSEALTGLKGRLWIDARSHVVTRVEGAIFKQVNFGLGVVARLYPGGQVMMEQAPVGGSRWLFLHFTQHLTVRAMMVKTVHDESEVSTSNFSLVSPMTYQDAIHLLLATPLSTH